MTSQHRIAKRIRYLLSWIASRWKLALLLTTLPLVLAAEGPPPARLSTQIVRLLVSERFDFVGWEIDALLTKLTHSMLSPQRYMDEPSRHDFFLDYLALVSEIQQVEWEIHRTYTDPQTDDPKAEAAALHAQLDELRSAEEIRQSLAESILEEQISSVLVGEGFGIMGQEMPPVSAHFTPLPAMLIISPRDHIERIYSLGLAHGLDATRRETIEEQVDAAQDVSSLVTSIGGLSAYPSMLLESSSLNWIAEVSAHEWAHHYLTPRPLGWNYTIPETQIINETVASIVGKEVGALMLGRYYPEHLPPEPEPEPEEPAGTEEETPEELPPEPLTFDFRQEMRKTRIHVDELLAQGEIEVAEAYMEERRQAFVANGYYLRKLNQAYFAFHGAYADEPGAAGADPRGPKVQELRAHSPDLHTFVMRVSRVTTLAELEALLDEMVSTSLLHGRQARRRNPFRAHPLCGHPLCGHPLHGNQRQQPSMCQTLTSLRSRVQ